MLFSSLPLPLRFPRRPGRYRKNPFSSSSDSGYLGFGRPKWKPKEGELDVQEDPGRRGKRCVYVGVRSVFRRPGTRGPFQRGKSSSHFQYQTSSFSIVYVPMLPKKQHDWYEWYACGQRCAGHTIGLTSTHKTQIADQSIKPSKLNICI